MDCAVHRPVDETEGRADTMRPPCGRGDKEKAVNHGQGLETSVRPLTAGFAIRLKVGNRRIRQHDQPNMETQIKESLRVLMAGIKASDGQVIADEMARLEALLAQGRAGLHPQLVHFLENRSYAKALMFLGGESSIPVGVCGGRAETPGNAGLRPGE